MKYLKPGTIKRIHVSQVNLRANRKDGGKRHVFTIQLSSGPLHAHKVKLYGSSELVSRPDKPLKCGARIWIETTGAVEYA